MVRTLAKRAMTTKGQKASYVIDHLVEALGGDPSSSLRRALILVDVDQYPGSTQTAVMERLHVDKSTVNREMEWLFNYGCIMREASSRDGREIRLHTCGYSKAALNNALDYFNGDHDMMKGFLAQLVRTLRQEKPTLRDAKIIVTLYEAGDISKQAVMERLYCGAASTENRAVNKLIEEGVIENA